MDDTRETSNKEIKDVETHEDNEQQNEQSTWFDEINEPKVMGRDGQELEESVSDKTEENAEPNSETNDENLPTELKIVVNGKEEQFSLKDKKQLEKVIEYAQKGRYTETIQEAKKEFEEQKTLVNDQLSKLSYAYLMNINSGQIELQEPKRNDYLDPDGKFYYQYDDEDKAKQAFNQASENYEKTVKAVKQFQSKAIDSYEQYKKTITDFQTSHPEIKDVKQFMADHVNPLVKPLLSFGAEPLPKELLEAVYFYKYKDEIIKKAIERDRKGLKDDKPINVKNIKVSEKTGIKTWGDEVKNQNIVFR